MHFLPISFLRPKPFTKLVLAVVITFLVPSITNAATFAVTTTADTQDSSPGNGICADSGGNCSLRAAISEANALAGDDVITLPAGTYTQALVSANDNANAGGDWDIAGNLTINGAGAATTIIQANAAPGVATERVVDIRSGVVVINGLTIQNGRFNGTMTTSTRGAGVQNLADLTLSNVIVRDNRVNSTSGNSIAAGVHNEGTALKLISTTVTSNLNNRVSGGSAFGGGVTSISAATITITDSSITGNTVTSQSGGFGFGAGLYLENVFNVTATNSRFDNNTGSGTSGSNGSGVRALSNIGAAVFTATNCTFSGNSGAAGTNNQGQGIQFFTTTSAAGTLTATLDRVSINGNTGNGPGMGINATLTGGAMNLTVRDTTISNNTGGSNGGGMLVSNFGGISGSTGTFNFVNSTISGNSVIGSGGGFALEQPVAAAAISVNFDYCTVANNTANSDNSGTESGGGLIRASGTLNLKNSIVADNLVGTGGSGPDISGTITSQDYNHIENVAGGTFTPLANDVTGTDPSLGPLANNGGSTLTHLPAPASPVTDAIPNGVSECGTTITSSQNGNTRPSDTGCEKGAAERSPLVPTAAEASISGRVTTSDGRGIQNAVVVVTGDLIPDSRYARTGAFGYYQIDGLEAGRTYVVTIVSKRFTFQMPSRVISLNDSVGDIDFTATPPE